MTYEHAFHMQLAPGAAATYTELHNPLPDAVLRQLRDATISDYAIFVDGDHVFGHFRYRDRERLQTVLAEDVAPEWTASVIDLTVERTLDPDLPLIRGIQKAFGFSSDGDRFTTEDLGGTA